MSLSGQAAALPPLLGLVAHTLRWRLLSELARSDLRVRELVALVGQPQNLVSYHLRLLRSGGLVTARRSSFDGRDSYYHLDLERLRHGLAAAGAALHPALASPPAPPVTTTDTVPTVLFTCTGNSARSPIAESLLRHHTGGRVAVTSAGSHPRPRLHPGAVAVLRERYGIDIADRRPRHLDTLTGRRFDYVISLCDKVREVCPDFGDHSRKVHWSLPDPAAAEGADPEVFARTAAEIDLRVRHLLPQLTLPA
ncbi:ArsR family transcriptional regulator [Actinomadura sp. SCN-SB]|uniref:arsenate reductase/protein-tyrosine-phosphatase family protein n=1 Tax=Actinomadura sp. SCN-SB TaxID=3373092 RepID=UPI00375160AE